MRSSALSKPSRHSRVRDIASKTSFTFSHRDATSLSGSALFNGALNSRHSSVTASPRRRCPRNVCTEKPVMPNLHEKLLFILWKFELCALFISITFCAPRTHPFFVSRASKPKLLPRLRHLALRRSRTVAIEQFTEAAGRLAKEKGEIHEHSASTRNYLWPGHVIGHGCLARCYSKCSGCTNGSANRRSRRAQRTNSNN